MCGYEFTVFEKRKQALKPFGMQTGLQNMQSFVDKRERYLLKLAGFFFNY